MIDYLFNIFFKSTVYIRFSSSLIHVRLVEKNRTIEEKPLIAISRKNGKYRVAGVGKEADIVKSKDPSSVTIHNAFNHPRTFVSNIDVAEATLRQFVYLVIQRKVMVRPLIILHPLEKIDGGITHIELKGLLDLGLSIGGRKVYVWTGRNLKDIELLNSEFLERNCVRPDGTISQI